MYRPELEVREDPRGRFIQVWRGRDFEEVNYLEIRRGKSRGGHYHRRNEELIIVARGRVEMEVENVRTGLRTTLELGEGDCVVLEPYDRHAFTARVDSVLVSCNTAAPYDRAPPDVFQD